MRIEVYPCGIYRILKISGKLIISQLEELKQLITGYLSQGERFVAVHFSDASYLYSGAIAVLVSCYKLVRDANGDLCLLEPKSEMVDLLCQMGIDALIPIYDSEDSLPQDHRLVEEICI
ncbi:MAG: STAS domain-containing protein [Fibrobacter sp.]|jgi:anti-anti-sigma factor|nr:STAS domain-containing protein [Fibrobacter sp.]